MIDVRIERADYADAGHAALIVDLLDAYAVDPMGGGQPLSDVARANLVSGLASLPGAFSLIAFVGDQAVGLANCLPGFASFLGHPVVNVHDIVVVPDMRGRGVGRALFAEIERIAAERGACKVTLEVLSGNVAARALYSRLGYGDYQLDPAFGHAMYWQKKLAA